MVPQFQTSHKKSFDDSKYDSPTNKLNPSQNVKWNTPKREMEYTQNHVSKKQNLA